MFENFNLAFGTNELFREGGPFVIAIFATGVLMWGLFLERYIFFATILPRQAKELPFPFNVPSRP